MIAVSVVQASNVLSLAQVIPGGSESMLGALVLLVAAGVTFFSPFVMWLLLSLLQNAIILLGSDRDPKFGPILQWTGLGMWIVFVGQVVVRVRLAALQGRIDTLNSLEIEAALETLTAWRSAFFVAFVLWCAMAIRLRHGGRWILSVVFAGIAIGGQRLLVYIS
ncbi:MAG: hypothetical protein EA382_09360 [Spirochaetaceae bacterium]|nr:MAG: hypothetical protein EA382_09360 [Spirochaetaceae bacterium]